MNNETANNKIDLNTPVTVIPFGKKSNGASVMRTFAENGINTIGDLCLSDEQKLLYLSGIGHKTMKKIRNFLKEHGLYLGMTEVEQTAYTNDTKELELLERMENVIAEFLPVLAGVPDKTQALKDVLDKGRDVLEEKSHQLNDLIIRLNAAKEVFYAERVAYENYKHRQEKELLEQRRYELAKEIFLKEKGCLLTGWQRACRAVHKADLLLEALKEE